MKTATYLSGIFSDLLGVITLDIADINYSYSSKDMNILSYPDSALPKKGVAYRLFKLLVNTFRGMPARRNSQVKVNPDIAIFYSSVNQRKVFERFSSSGEMSTYKIGIFSDCNERVDNLVAGCVAIICLPILLCRVLNFNKYQLRSLSYAIDLYALAYGYYFIALRFFRRVKPKILLISNDHVCICRAFFRAASNSGVKTAYIQHASITSRFPPLEFDLAMLEGMDALEKYRVASVRSEKELTSKIVLVGSDSIFMKSARSFEKEFDLGICISTHDKRTLVLSTIDKLRDEFPKLKVALRVHPGDVEGCRFYTKTCGGVGISWREESSLDFISSCKKIISTPSNIVLEAAANGVPVGMYDFSSGDIGDHYGFVEKGVAKGLSDFSDIRNYVTNMNDECSESSASYFYENLKLDYVGTVYENQIMALKSLLRSQ